MIELSPESMQELAEFGFFIICIFCLLCVGVIIFVGWQITDSLLGDYFNELKYKWRKRRFQREMERKIKEGIK